jgi:signal transduction histidine kinase/ActR/RegA family two-component response regulator
VEQRERLVTQFDSALADQFASLITASPQDLHAAVISAQRTMCTILGMDRSSIWQGSSEAPEVLRMTHLCTLDEIPPVPADITSNREFPWFTAQLLAGRTVAVPDNDALPREAAVDRASLAYYLDKSTLAIPFPRRPGECAGVITFSATTRRESWSEAVLAKCRLVVEVIHAVLLRASAEEATRTERTKLRTILDSTSTDLIWYVDSSGYALASWNRAYAQYCQQLTGTAVKIGDTPEVIFRGDTTRVRRWSELYERAVREGTFTIEQPLDTDGIVVLLEFNAVVEDGRCVGVAAFGRDVTLQKRQQAELEELQRQLTHAQKLEAIGRLAAAVAHDFNNLLTVIMATTGEIRADLVDRGDRDARSLAASLEPIDDAAAKGAALTKRLLTLARPQPRQPRPIDVVEVLSEAEPLLRRLLPKNIALSISAPPRRAYVLAESSQLDQVVLNLAVNARDAMHGGGRLDVRVEERDLDGSSLAAFQRLAPGPYVELTVSDTGEGIPPDVLGRIFEPFFTTKQPGKGSGLGLATVLGIVRQAGGDVTVRSRVGEGTEFCLLFPRTTAPVEAPATGAPAVSAARGETVLVTDDDADVRSVLERMLRGGGYRVLTAATGDEALTLLQAENGRVDLLVTDVVMSGMSGLELGRRVRAGHPKMPILFITGFSNASPEELASVSPLPVLAKPCTMDALARAARVALAGASPR